jgi:hypothetical protein
VRPYIRNNVNVSKAKAYNQRHARGILVDNEKRIVLYDVNDQRKSIYLLDLETRIGNTIKVSPDIRDICNKNKASQVEPHWRFYTM